MMTEQSEPPSALARARAQLVEALRDLSADALVVAFSGGPDSTCLLALASEALPADLELLALHVDHGLRPVSAAEAERARALAVKLGARFELRRLDGAKATARGVGNMQAWARQGRHDALLQLARETSARAVVALGHTADDQAETVLMRLLRGSGSAGLRSMAMRDVFDGVPMLRPLLDVRRGEIELELSRRDLVPLRDPSNAGASYLRNRLRQRVLPLLAEENPRAVEALCRTAQNAREEHDALRWVAVAELSRLRGAARAAADAGAIDAAGLRELPVGLRYHVLRAAFAELTGSLRRLERAHLEALDAALQPRGGPSRAVSLPGAQAFIEGGSIVFERAGHQSLARGAELSGAGAGEVLVRLERADIVDADEGLDVATPAGTLRLSLGSGERREVLHAISLETCNFPLCLRRARAGDRIEIARNQRRKVARVLVDTKIPRRARADVVLLVCGAERDERILAIIGVRQAYGTRVDAGQPALRIEQRRVLG